MVGGVMMVLPFDLKNAAMLGVKPALLSLCFLEVAATARVLDVDRLRDALATATADPADCDAVEDMCDVGDGLDVVDDDDEGEGEQEEE